MVAFQDRSTRAPAPTAQLVTWPSSRPAVLVVNDLVLQLLRDLHGDPLNELKVDALRPALHRLLNGISTLIAPLDATFGRHSRDLSPQSLQSIHTIFHVLSGADHVLTFVDPDDGLYKPRMFSARDLKSLRSNPTSAATFIQDHISTFERFEPSLFLLMSCPLTAPALRQAL